MPSPTGNRSLTVLKWTLRAVAVLAVAAAIAAPVAVPAPEAPPAPAAAAAAPATALQWDCNGNPDQGRSFG
ncbi:hypothetical protein [Streptomyces yangpuensis]